MVLMLASLLCISTSAQTPTTAITSTIKVDSSHQIVKHAPTVKPEHYHVPAAEVLVLDASDYSFTIPEIVRDKPLGTLVLYRDKQHRYLLSWKPGQLKYELSDATLVPAPGSSRFEGFHKGEKWGLGIGITHDVDKWEAVWATIIEIE